jgi:hypothetical protein
MKSRVRLRASTGGFSVLWLLGAAIALTSCAKYEKPPEIAYVETTTLPSKLAVMPVRFLTIEKNAAGDFPVQAKSDKGKFISELARGVIQNQLAGKGFDMRVLSVVHKHLKGAAIENRSPQELCQKLEVEGLVFPEIITATMVTGVAYDLFKIDAKIRLINSSGTELGSWKNSASKRKISIPTSPVGIATTIAGAFLDESAKKQMRLVIYDWGWKVTQFVPDSPLGKTMPEVVSVDSNIDKGIFAAGEQIVVEVVAEKNLACTFDLGKFKKSLPLADIGGGAYKGIYVIEEGDLISNQPLSVHLFRSNGVERVWLETGGMVTIDGVLPPAPEQVEAQASRGGVNLNWTLPQGEDLKAFAVEKSDTAVGDFTIVSTTKDLNYLDADVSQGQTYYYRIRAVDMAGNRSPKHDTVEVVMPFYDEVTMTGELSGTWVSGVYRIKGVGAVSSGNVLTIGAGAKLIMESDARILVNGVLKVKGASQRPVFIEGQNWHGIEVGERGQAELTFVNLKGCITCLNIDSGSVVMHDVSIKGNHGDGIVIKEDGVVAIKGGQVSGCLRGIVLEGGKAIIEKSTLTRNDVGVDITNGAFSLDQSNVFDNAESNIRTHRKIVLENNYLGTTNTKDLKLDGDVLVKSLLDAPSPHGRTMVLIDEKKITPELLEKRFTAHKQKGIEAFQARRYGDAYQSLSKALNIREDKEIYLYLAYTQSSLGEDENMAKTLDQGIMAFPYEVRLYQIYVKYLAANGQKEKAISLLEKAVQLNPEDQNLVFMKQYVESMEQ